MTFSITRRTLLAATAAASFLPLSAAATTARIVRDYRGSQPTGWPRTPGHSFGMTAGGHRTAVDFDFNGRPHKVSLLPADLVYRDKPTDPEVGFVRTLNDAFGRWYDFRYTGGLRGHFSVQSYSVFLREPSANDPSTGFGADLYVVYKPGLPVDGNLQWIQVVNQAGTREVDNLWRANPWYAYGGLVSINGDEVVNFRDAPQIGVGGNIKIDVRFIAETFLAQDTGKKDADGRAIVNILGGFSWGWQARQS